MTSTSTTTDPALTLPSARRRRHHVGRPLVRHGVEMVLAMLAGMRSHVLTVVAMVAVLWGHRVQTPEREGWQ